MTTKKSAPSDPKKAYSKAKLTGIVKKQKLRIKRLEEKLAAVKELDDQRRGELARISRVTDKMGMALRTCMKALNISRNDIASS